MDLGKINEQLEHVAGATKFLQLRHPIDNSKLTTEDGQPIGLRLRSIDSPEASAIQSKLAEETLRRVSDGDDDISAERVVEYEVRILVSVTAEVVNLSVHGNEVVNTPEALTRLYTDNKWVREQVGRFVKARENFLPE